MIDFTGLPIKLVRPGNCLMCTGVAEEPIEKLMLCEEHEHLGPLTLKITVFDNVGPHEEEAKLL